MEQKTIYPAWITEFGFGIPITITANPDGTITAKDDNSSRYAIGNDLGEAISLLNQATEDARLIGEL